MNKCGISIYFRYCAEINNVHQGLSIYTRNDIHTHYGNNRHLFLLLLYKLLELLMILRHCYIVIFCILATQGVVAQRIDDIKKEINQIIKYDTEIDFKNTPGFIVGIIDGESTHFIPFGQRAKTEEGDITPQDVFEVGSLSKTITSSLISALDHNGALSREDLINDLLPDAYRNPRMENLRVIDLLNHQSGFPKIPKHMGSGQKSIQDPYNHYSKADLLTYYAHYIPQEKNPKFSYSHTNYALLEIIIEEVTGSAFDDLIRKYLFSKLGMDHSFVTFKEKKEIIQGYNRAQRKVNPWNFPSFAGAEGVKSSAFDLIEYIKGQIGISGTELDQVLPEYLVIEGPTSYNDKIFIGNGWHILEQGKYPIWTHTGTTSGHSAFLAFIKETKTGVVILSNSSFGTKDLGFLILRMINYNWKRKA